MQEFSLIETFFAQASAGTNHSQVVLGIGDDAAILDVPPEQQLLVSTDTLVSGVHFFSDVAPADLAYKALAVNLSDMAAMGATPTWVSLALTLPKLPPALFLCLLTSPSRLALANKLFGRDAGNLFALARHVGLIGKALFER